MLITLLGGWGGARAVCSPALPSVASWLLGPVAGDGGVCNRDPFAWSPPPSGHRLRLQGDFELLLRERHPQRQHEYRREAARLGWSWRRGDRWLTAGLRRDATVLANRQAHTDDDELDARRLGDGWELGGGLRRGPWVAEGAVGRTHDWEGTATLAWLGRPGRVTVHAALLRPRWLIDQAFLDRRYRFDLPLRRERLALAVLPTGHWWPRAELLREVAIGEPDRTDGDYNELYVIQHGARLLWSPWSGGGDLAAGWTDGRLELEMFADGAPYLNLEAMDFHGAHLAGRSPAGPLNLCLLAGFEEWRATAHEGYLEPYPFLFWEVFRNNKFALQELDYRLAVTWLGVGRSFQARRSSRWRVDLAAEYGWLAGGGVLAWKERVPVVWPLLYRWEDHRRDIPRPADGLLRVNIGVGWSLAPRWRLQASVRQLIPLVHGGEDDGGGGDDGGDPLPGPSPAETASFVFGGFRAQVALEWRPR